MSNDYLQLAVTTPGLNADYFFYVCSKLVRDHGFYKRQGEADSIPYLTNASNPLHCVDNQWGVELYLEGDGVTPVLLMKSESSDLAAVQEERALRSTLSKRELAARELPYVYMPKSYLHLLLSGDSRYRGENSAGSFDLLAWLLRELGEWLTKKGYSWTWWDPELYWREEWHLSERLEELRPTTWGTLGDPDYGDPTSSLVNPTPDDGLFLQALLEQRELFRR